MTIFSAILLATLCVLLLSLPRRLAVLPFLICTLYITWDQSLVIAGQHFFCGFIMVLIGMLRLMVKQEFFVHETDRITLFIVLYAVVNMLTFLLLYGGNGSSVRIRAIITAVGLYFYFKSVIRSYDDIIATMKFLPFLIAPIALFMLGEHVTGHNIFAKLGGVPDQSFIRYGKVRSQGPFSHPILAGTFGATVMPFIVALWYQPPVKKSGASWAQSARLS